jgi:CHASE2 domain-containing sensor protein
VLLNTIDLPLVDTLDKHVGDYRIAYGSQRAPKQRDDIAVVLITEQTLLDYESRSPIDRRLVGEVIRAVDAAKPKAIGVDLIFDRRTSQDQNVIAAIRQANAPIVLGSIDERVAGIDSESLLIQAEFLKAVNRPHGHVMLARKEGMLAVTDSVVRYIAPPYEGATESRAVTGATRSGAAGPLRTPSRSLIDELAAAAGISFQPKSRVIAWQRSPDASTPLFLRLEVPRHAPADLKRGLEGLVSPIWRELLKDRIVLIGATMIDRDQHLSPLSVVDRAPTAGIFIHAQALAQRIDKREVWELPAPVVWAVSALVALACLIAARRNGLQPHSFGYGVVGLVLIGLMSFGAYRLLLIDFPSVALATAWALGGAGGFLLSKLSGGAAPTAQHGEAT